MKKDLNHQLLLEEQLKAVQGGYDTEDVNAKMTIIFRCLYPGCNWSYRCSTAGGGEQARHEHTQNNPGHNEFSADVQW
ncbi:hypothetical protein [Syntrophomonas wolfei]|uniref:hypothetical protein n=1 Tax=Syntrophomonas wolfei TaxID=863 RepID=UPI00059D99D1|nr:hypothetical protein [Syntrophomonas wolfei]